MDRETRQSVKEFKGHYLVFRLGDRDMPDRIGGQPMPTKRHHSWSAAFEEAKQLNDHNPETTFVVMREMGRVKRVRAHSQEF